jgi:endonuclease V-like protein UPF0215 family
MFTVNLSRFVSYMALELLLTLFMLQCMTDGITGSLFNILSPKEQYGWKEQPCLVIMMYKMACVYKHCC